MPKQSAVIDKITDDEKSHILELFSLFKQIISKTKLGKLLMDIQIFLLGCLTTLYFILPAYFSNGGALAFGGGTPVDFGKKDSKGVRWIGDGVTWRGLIAGTLIGMLTGAVQGLLAPSILSAIGPYIITPIITDVHSGIIIGFLLGFGALVGDALGSFLKRRLGIGRGKPAPFLEKEDSELEEESLRRF